MKSRLYITQLLVLLFLFSCSYDALEDVEPEGINDQLVSFTSQVKPIFETKCAFSGGCHGNGATGRPVFETYAVIKENVDNGKINTKVFVQMSMPKPPTTLSENERNLLKRWMDQGAPNN